MGADDGAPGAAGTILSILFTMNLVLFVFNLFPIPPLDGAGALGVLLTESAARRLQETFASAALALFGLLSGGGSSRASSADPRRGARVPLRGHQPS